MRRLVIAIVLLVCSQAWAADPRFSDYPAGAAYRGPAAAPDVSSGDARSFRTRIRAGMAAPANFAGHYTLVLWGCGAECLMGVAVDRVSGHVVFTSTVCCTKHWPPDDAEAIQGHIDSRLITLTGQINEQGADATHYYTFDGTRFSLLKSVPFAAEPVPKPHDAGQPRTDCKAIGSATARLDCYDRASGRS